jgi:hypothetical protein
LLCQLLGVRVFVQVDLGGWQLRVFSNAGSLTNAAKDIFLLLVEEPNGEKIVQTLEGKYAAS